MNILRNGEAKLLNLVYLKYIGNMKSKLKFSSLTSNKNFECPVSGV